MVGPPTESVEISSPLLIGFENMVGFRRFRYVLGIVTGSSIGFSMY